jgi:hypothetical protein
VRDRAWLALRSVGAGARARVPGMHARVSPAPICARCVRKCSLHWGIARGSHCARWVLGHAHVSPARTRECPRHLFACAACANVPGIGARARARALRTQGLHESSLSTQALPYDGAAVCPEIDTRLLGITAGMPGPPGLAKPSRKGSGGKTAKSNRAESSAGRFSAKSPPLAV